MPDYAILKFASPEDRKSFFILLQQLRNHQPGLRPIGVALRRILQRVDGWSASPVGKPEKHLTSASGCATDEKP